MVVALECIIMIDVAVRGLHTLNPSFGKTKQGDRTVEDRRKAKHSSALYHEHTLLALPVNFGPTINKPGRIHMNIQREGYI